MKKKDFLFSLVAVLIIGLIVSSASFAYFQWSSGVADRTSVNVTIQSGQITMHIETEDTTYTGLKPVKNCNNSVAYGDALVKIVNNTGAMGIPSFKLNFKLTKNGSGELTDAALSSIHYSVVPIDTNIDSGAKIGTEVATCDNPASFNFGENTNLHYSVKQGVATGTFSGVSTEGLWTELPGGTDFLPKQFDKVAVEPYGVTFLGRPHKTSYQWFRVYVWIDNNYSSVNIGNVVSDPLQNAVIEVTWSANSIIEQVASDYVDTGTDTGVVLNPGLYNSEGTLVSTWEQLIENSISINDTTITSASGSMTGKLVIAEGITNIDYQAFSDSSLTSVVFPDSLTYITDSAFYSSSLEEIIFGENSQLSSIDNSAFYDTQLTNVVLPNSFSGLGSYAFYNTPLESIILPSGIQSIGEEVFYGTPLTEITFKGTKEAFLDISLEPTWFSGSSLLKVVCSDEEILIMARDAGLYDLNGTLISTWDELKSSGKVVVDGTKITSVDSSMTGELTISPDITIIGDNSFFQSSLRTVDIPYSVETIGNTAFGMSSIRYFNFSEFSQLQTIDKWAFYDAWYSSITLPKSVRSIAAYAFETSMLEEIKYKGTTDEWSYIQLEENWNYGISATKVICSDGEINF